MASALGRAAASLRADRAVCRCDCIPLLDPAQRVPLRVRHTYFRHTRGEEASSSHPPFCALTTSISAHSGTHTHHTHRGTKLTLVLPYLSPPGLARISQSQIEFSVGTSSHVLAKHFDFTVRRSCAHIPRTPLRTLHQLLGIAPTIDPAQSLFTARESHNLHLLACAGMAVNIHGVHIEQAELLLGAAAAPAVRFRSAGASSLQAAGWWSHAVGSGATSSSPLTMIKGSSSISVWWTFSSFAHRRDF